MANCGGTSISPTAGCFSNCGSPTFTQSNCGCTPCTAPVIVQGDLSNQVLVPVLADVIQNCICLSRCETAYPTNLLVETNLPFAPTDLTPAPSGAICITDINYSYSCIGYPGIPGTAAAPGAAPTIPANVGCNAVTLTTTTPSCSCTAADGTTVTNLYTDFSGLVRTGTCCCNQVAQAYSQNKIVERGIQLSACNLNITVSGTIGGRPFTGIVRGAFTAGTPGVLTAFENPTPLIPAAAPATSPLGFTGPLNFSGIMCLPTSTRLTINETFDSCLSIDCIRPVNATYTPTATADPGQTLAKPLVNAAFLVSADLSLIISKNIFATTSEKLAVISSAGAQVVCSDNVSPACPQSSTCPESPCPGPRPVQ